MKKRLPFLGLLLLDILMVYLLWATQRLTSYRVFLVILFLLMALYGLIFPDKVKMSRDDDSETKED